MDSSKDKKQANEIKKEKGARKEILEDMFNDYYRSRHKVYKMNFFRGIFFGLGSVIGGTIVVALVIWLISFFVDLPVIGDIFKQAEKALTQPQ